MAQIDRVAFRNQLVLQEGDVNSEENTRIRSEHYAVMHEHLLPPRQAQLFIPLREHRFFLFGKYIQRLLFYGGQEWEDWEVKAIEEYRQYLRENPSDVIPPDYEEQDLLKNIQAANMNHKKTSMFLEISIKFRKEHMPVKVNSEIARCLESGFIYVHGRDRCFRPIVVVRPGILQKMNPKCDPHDIMMAIITTQEYMIKNMMIHGQLENWVAIYDLGGLGLWDIPYKALGVTVQTLSKIYKCRTTKMFVLNASNGFFRCWKMISKFIEERTLAKIQIHTENTCDELMEAVHPSQVEERFGGTASNVDDYFWPPYMPSDEFGVDQKFLCTEQQHEQYCQENQNFSKLRPLNQMTTEEQKRQVSLKEIQFPTEEDDRHFEASLSLVSPMNADLVTKMPQELKKPDFFEKVESPSKKLTEEVTSKDVQLVFTPESTGRYEKTLDLQQNEQEKEGEKEAEEKRSEGANSNPQECKVELPVEKDAKKHELKGSSVLKESPKKKPSSCCSIF